MLSRRRFLALSGALASAPSWASIAVSNDEKTLFASAFSKSKTEHFFGLFDTKGNLFWQTRLPDRAHAPVVHPNQTIVGIVARRPGFYMDFFNVTTHEKLIRIEPEKEHHFYGHAIFSHDGQRLITQENHYPSGEGKIFVREWPSGQVLNVYSSHGIGPHESVLLNDDVLVIANGGLKTHPRKDREILNLDTMSPNVTYLSLQNGERLNQASNAEELHQLSIRHLDVNQKGTVALGFQYQGPLWDQVPLVALSRIDQPELDYLPIPEQVRARFKQYCGSVCFDQSGDVLAISTPRGGFVAYWHVDSKTFLGIDNCRDVCGLIAHGNAHEFILTTGTGSQFVSNPVQEQINLINKHPTVHWDNHLRQINT
ncbi:DUF1513 domain-containing protein [Marinomonas posidonica]|uniref:Uncharacterized conserved protein UCP028101 n=1 Tax=Marinomonas posidonica (strain CECT 7376 / NCIMB 14433 / IVIA-Po-181) TaxID=491952 RepID=F6CXY2_MARPP|nr:DUF1513 domain-containing protein [Marinomonas posidonica]AEF54544.1 Uncharacterized conserved protein UCP028101 [Marinomonas posidonica IVIA-Po-181]